MATKQRYSLPDGRRVCIFESHGKRTGVYVGISQGPGGGRGCRRRRLLPGEDPLSVAAELLGEGLVTAKPPPPLVVHSDYVAELLVEAIFVRARIDAAGGCQEARAFLDDTISILPLPATVRLVDASARPLRPTAPRRGRAA